MTSSVSHQLTLFQIIFCKDSNSSSSFPILFFFRWLYFFFEGYLKYIYSIYIISHYESGLGKTPGDFPRSTRVNFSKTGDPGIPGEKYIAYYDERTRLSQPPTPKFFPWVPGTFTRGISIFWKINLPSPVTNIHVPYTF